MEFKFTTFGVHTERAGSLYHAVIDGKVDCSVRCATARNALNRARAIAKEVAGNEGKVMPDFENWKG